VKAWNRLHWLSTESCGSGGLFKHGNEPFGSIKGGDFLDELSYENIATAWGWIRHAVSVSTNRLPRKAAVTMRAHATVGLKINTISCE
jgi:hypothetical protein